MSIFALKFNNPKEILKSIIKFFILIQLVALVYFFLNPIKLGTQVIKVWGWVASGLYIITLLPGIITRFNIKGKLSEIGKTIFFARTQLGISMFFAVFLHYILKVKSLIQTNNYPPKEIELYFVFGFLAMLLSFILLVTSNQQSKKLLKKNWFRLHKLTYAILGLAFLHVAVLERGLFMLIFGIAILLEVASFGYSKFGNKQKLLAINNCF
jgi:DMSO/TMAO reductase YedYZ heme-binding membrane subunit